MSEAEKLLNEALAAYDFGGQLVGAVRYGSGHINDTFVVHTQPGEDPCRRFILQRISSAAFKHPDEVMANIVGVTSFLGEKIKEAGGNPARETMSVWATKSGENFYTDSEGGAWRVYPFVEDTICLQKAETPELFRASAVAFGKFQRMLKDYPADTLYETIPKFHDTENRLRTFKRAVQRDVKNRVRTCKKEIDFVLARAADCSVLMDGLRQGKLPLRVTHNDTKLNNILFDAETGKGMCIIDLDTIMPGLALNDFGDSIRFGATRAAEDESDVSKVHFELALFEAYTKGYLEAAGDVLTDAEKEYLPWGAKIITLECGMRFLTDYLQGDVYFKTQYPHHNLVRCRTQFKLVAEMEEHFDEMKAIVKKYSEMPGGEAK